MLSKIITGSVNGINIEKVTVETDFSQGLPYLSLVGLPDATVRESKERIRSAIINSGFVFPMKRITINLSPADTRKSGSHFDLPMAVGILLSQGQFKEDRINDSAFIGELSLDGKLNGVDSCVALVLGLKEYGVKDIYVPHNNLSSMPKIKGVNIYGVHTFTELVDHLMGMNTLHPAVTGPISKKSLTNKDKMDYMDIYGQESAKRAMQICATGWHHILLTGPPGSGKTMLASRLPTIMSQPSEEEKLEIRRIKSISGEVDNGGYEDEVRPFRAPHHTVTATSLMGGGINPKPGELSLAHRGVLFLDELPEFERRILDMLRQPLETGYINLSRLKAKHKYPCDFILVAAMNPCKCGFYNVPGQICTCGTSGRERYAERVSGPLRDRIDINLNINGVNFKELQSNKIAPTSSTKLKEGVNVGIKRQERRYANEDFSYNSKIPDWKLNEYCKLDTSSTDMLSDASDKFKLSARAVARIKKVARTIADIEDSEDILIHHIAEAISYREITEYGS